MKGWEGGKEPPNTRELQVPRRPQEQPTTEKHKVIEDTDGGWGATEPPNKGAASPNGGHKNNRPHTVMVLEDMHGGAKEPPNKDATNPTGATRTTNHTPRNGH